MGAWQEVAIPPFHPNKAAIAWGKEESADRESLKRPIFSKVPTNLKDKYKQSFPD